MAYILGAIVEWKLDGEDIERLLKAFNRAGGTHIDSDTLNFYRAAYLAFRLGQCSLAAQAHNPDERNRVLAANAVYRQQLAEFLGVGLSAQAV